MSDKSQQSLVVVAQTGTRLSDGTVIHETDSQAVQITANVSGTRSINAMNALTGTTNELGVAVPLSGADAVITDIVKAAKIHNGFVGSPRPTLQTDGNFTAVTGDIYTMTTCSRPVCRPDQRSWDIGWRWEPCLTG